MCILAQIAHCYEAFESATAAARAHQIFPWSTCCPVSVYSHLCYESWSLWAIIDPLYFLLSRAILACNFSYAMSILVSNTELIKLYSFGIVQGLCLSIETSLDLLAQDSSPTSLCLVVCVFFSGCIRCLGILYPCPECAWSWAHDIHSVFFCFFHFCGWFCISWPVGTSSLDGTSVPDPGSSFSALIQYFTHLSLTVA